MGSLTRDEKSEVAGAAGLSAAQGGLGAAGTGAMVGASIGAVGTPVGALIGAGIGALVGAIGGAIVGGVSKKKEIKAAKAAEEASASAQAGAQQASAMRAGEAELARKQAARGTVMPGAMDESDQVLMANLGPGSGNAYDMWHKQVYG